MKHFYYIARGFLKQYLYDKSKADFYVITEIHSQDTFQ